MRDGNSLKLPPRRHILFVGDATPGTTTSHRIRTLGRLGQKTTVFNIGPYQPRQRLLAILYYRFPAEPVVYRINRDLLRAVRKHKPDVVWFEKPTVFTPATIRAIRQSGASTVCYNLDNPFGPRNDGCWYQFRKVFRLFDLHCVPRTADVARYRSWGVPFVKVLLSFEPSVHYPPPETWCETDRSRQVSFIGTPYEERPAFLTRLVVDGKLPVVISGTRFLWKRLLRRDIFERCFAEGELLDDAYREGIWRSKINLSFITRLNEEDIAHKAVEIAACQGFLLAIRTPGHQEIFEEDREAVFFSSVEECADKCRFYLPRPDLREAIARRGRERAVRSGYDNDTQLRLVLDRLDGRA
jgi:spore maturation protein CgeB